MIFKKQTTPNHAALAPLASSGRWTSASEDNIDDTKRCSSLWWWLAIGRPDILISWYLDVLLPWFPDRRCFGFFYFLLGLQRIPNQEIDILLGCCTRLPRAILASVIKIMVIKVVIGRRSSDWKSCGYCCDHGHGPIIITIAIAAILFNATPCPTRMPMQMAMAVQTAMPNIGVHGALGSGTEQCWIFL